MITSKTHLRQIEERRNRERQELATKKAENLNELLVKNKGKEIAVKELQLKTLLENRPITHEKALHIQEVKAELAALKKQLAEICSQTKLC